MVTSNTSTLYNSNTVASQGVLIVIDAQASTVLRISDGCERLLGVSPSHSHGAHLADVVGEVTAAAVVHAASTVSEPGEHAFLNASLGHPARAFFLTVHHSVLTATQREVLVLEIHDPLTDGPEPAGPTEGVALEELATGESDEAILDALARIVQQVTGYDRASVHRFQEESSFRALTETTAPQVAPIVGGNFRSSAPRASKSDALFTAPMLYVASVVATPDLLHPIDDPSTEVDLRWALLRSLPDAGLGYLADSGTKSYFSAWIRRPGEPSWGMLACHHYREPRPIQLQTRFALVRFCTVAAERLETLRMRDRDQVARRSIELVTRTFSGMNNIGFDDVGLMLTDSRSILEYLGADGLVVVIGGRVRTTGIVPETRGIDTLRAWVADHDDEVVETHTLFRDSPELAIHLEGFPGVLAVNLPEGQSIIWLKRAKEIGVDWLNAPSVEERAPDTSPDAVLGTYHVQRTTLTDTTSPWTYHDLQTAAQIRKNVVESLYVQERQASEETLTLQRSLLPESLPQPPGWTIEGSCTPAGRGVVGGDWYDAFDIDDSLIALTVGDVTGHGLPAAAAMGRLRVTLRTCVLGAPDLSTAAQLFHTIAARSMPKYIATVIVVVVNLHTGQFEIANWGHLPALLVDTHGNTRWLDSAGAMPLGFAKEAPTVTVGTMTPDETMVLYSDGLVERRDEGLWDGLKRLREFLGSAPTSSAADIVTAVRDKRSQDDATILVMSAT